MIFSGNQETNTENNCVVLVSSCDKYSDAWIICSKIMEENWSSCPYEICLLTETKQAPEEAKIDRTIHVNSRIWSTMLHKALEKIDAEYVILLLEDQWTVNKIDQNRIEKAKRMMEENNEIGVIYFEASKNGGLKESFKIDDEYNEIPFGAPYRLSCAPGLFRKEFIYELTGTEISPWDFERIMSFDNRGAGKRILEMRKSGWKRIDETGAIYRGKWVPGVKDYAKNHGITLDLNVRKMQSVPDILKRKSKDLIFNLNPKMIVRLQNALHKASNKQEYGE